MIIPKACLYPKTVLRGAIDMFLGKYLPILVQRGQEVTNSRYRETLLYYFGIPHLSEKISATVFRNP